METDLYNLSDLPPFEDLLKTYDKEMCSSMLEALEVDLKNLADTSEKMLSLKAKMHSITVEEYISSQEKDLKNKLEMVKQKLERIA